MFFESPFMLAKVNESEAEMASMEWERGRRSAPHRPHFRPRRPVPPPPVGGDCDCGDSATDPASPDAGEYGEIESFEALETEGERGRRSIRRTPHFRPRRPAPAVGADCDCGNSASDPASADAGEYGETESWGEMEASLLPSQRPATRSKIADLAFDDSRAALRTALAHLRSLRDNVSALPSTSDPAFNGPMANLMLQHKRDIAVLARRLMIVPPDPSGTSFRNALDMVILLCERNLALGKTILAAGTTGLCDPSHPRNAKGLPWAWTLSNQPDPRTHLCNPFFGPKTSRDLRRDVVTHEYFHLLGLEDISVANTNEALRNANTIAQIVAFLTDRARQRNSDGHEPAVPPFPLDREMSELETELGTGAPTTADGKQSLVDETAGESWHTDLFEFDPYADIRPGLRPEHASLTADELTLVVGTRPTLVALHRMLSSPEPQLATLAILLGKAGRRSTRLNGSDVPIPTYLRLLSRLCREAADATETEIAQATEFEAPAMEFDTPAPAPPPDFATPKFNAAVDTFKKTFSANPDLYAAGQFYLTWSVLQSIFFVAKDELKRNQRFDLPSFASSGQASREEILKKVREIMDKPLTSLDLRSIDDFLARNEVNGDMATIRSMLSPDAPGPKEISAVQEAYRIVWSTPDISRPWLPGMAPSIKLAKGAISLEKDKCFDTCRSFARKLLASRKVTTLAKDLRFSAGQVAGASLAGQAGRARARHRAADDRLSLSFATEQRDPGYA